MGAQSHRTPIAPEENTGKLNPRPVERQWLRKLLQTHHGVDYSDPAYVLAPMVDQSDLPFRLLTRKYGCNLAFTPMVHSKLFTTMTSYHDRFMLADIPADRPLIAQLCGSNREQVLQTARELSVHCDAIDINCGCPQQIARRGNYGAFLLEKPDELLELVEYLQPRIDVPLTVKVRLVPGYNRDDSVQKSLALYRRLVDAGVHMLTIHGRTRLQKGHETGQADWAAIRKVVDELGDRVPIIANGSIGNWAEIRDCLAETKADGVMSSEAILEYPAFFVDEPKRTRGRVELAFEYMTIAKQYSPRENGQGSGLKCLKAHTHHFLAADMSVNTKIRDMVANSTKWEDLWDAIKVAEEMQIASNRKAEEEELYWYVRHRRKVVDASGCETTAGKVKQLRESAPKVIEEEDTGVKFSELFDEDGCY